jgi:hypothetical protein
MRPLYRLLLVLFVILSTFPSVFAEGGGKMLLTVPMVGAGTWEDPKRPAFVRETGVPFRYQVSDDGATAIVEAMPRTLAESAKLDDLAKKEPRARLYRPEKDKQSDVLIELKKQKRDFDDSAFTGLIPQGKTVLAPGAGK